MTIFAKQDCSIAVAADDVPMCPGCETQGHQVLGIKNGYTVRRCVSCAIAYVSDRPQTGELETLYDHYYDGSTFAASPEVVSTLERTVTSLEPFRKTGRWLDFGYGEGTLLTVAQRHNWQCFGAEVSPLALAYGERNGWVVSANVQSDPRFPQGGFDVVTMIELIEHVQAPSNLLRAAAGWLRPGGALYLTTPNAKSLNMRLLGCEWSVVSPPEHLTLWTARGIGMALQCAGFSVRRVRTEGLNPCEIQRRICRPGPKAPAVHRNVAAARLNRAFTSSPWRRAVKAAINDGLSLLRVGDSLKVLAVRDNGPTVHG